jgi:dephospho-CoA kinase
VGSGTGVIAALAQEMVGPTGVVVAVDPSEGMLAEAKKAGVRDTRVGRGEALPVGDGEFDILTMGYALRHVEDLVTTFREYSRALRPGGKVLLLTSSGGHYLQATLGGGHGVTAASTSDGPWESFAMTKVGGSGPIGDGDFIALAADNGNFVVAEGGGGGEVNANRPGIGAWETFRLEVAGSGGGGSAVLPEDTVLVPPKSVGPILGTVTGYEMDSPCPFADPGRCELPLYAHYNRDTDEFWDLLVQELLHSRVNVVMAHGRGCYDPISGIGGNGNMCPRLLTRLVAAIDAAFPGTAGPHGIDRPVLGRAVLGDRAALHRLERIVHPALAESRRIFLRRHRARPLVVLDIPLLFEKKGWRQVDAIAVVSAPAWKQARRVLARPGMNPLKLQNIRSLQLPDHVKRARADFVIANGGTVGRTRAAVRHLITCLRAHGVRYCRVCVKSSSIPKQPA